LNSVQNDHGYGCFESRASLTGNLFDSQYFEGLAQINQASPSSEADQRLTEATFAEWSNLAG
jgi:hypothetical protein